MKAAKFRDDLGNEVHLEREGDLLTIWFKLGSGASSGTALRVRGAEANDVIAWLRDCVETV